MLATGTIEGPFLKLLESFDFLVVNLRRFLKAFLYFLLKVINILVKLRIFYVEG